MKIFLSHATKDRELAQKLAERLGREGFAVWNAEEQIAPGDNWAKVIGKALDESDLMVILLTPGAMESEFLRKDIEFAISTKKYEGRVFSVFVGPANKASGSVPWILLKLPYRQVESAQQLGRAVRQILHHSERIPALSPTNA
jgi:hypothetical protein